MKDIQNRKDIEFMVNAFYKQVIDDEVIGFIFTDVVRLDWQKHLPIMYDFWETILLDEMKYKGNPIVKHIELNRKESILPKHFERWMSLWETTIKSSFSGPRADEAIKRAKLMGELMKYKIEQSKSDKFIQ
ncbi:MAG: group III truncated hemoglobin [Bacteroidetes bacterium]|nr:group III truncated hemoglobin [Bacteroidota bacterium]